MSGKGSRGPGPSSTEPPLCLIVTSSHPQRRALLQAHQPGAGRQPTPASRHLRGRWSGGACGAGLRPCHLDTSPAGGCSHLATRTQTQKTALGCRGQGRGAPSPGASAPAPPPGCQSGNCQESDNRWTDNRLWRSTWWPRDRLPTASRAESQRTPRRAWQLERPHTHETHGQVTGAPGTHGTESSVPGPGRAGQPASP